MINANDLRIGNWVMYDNRLFQIEAISRSLPCLNTDEFGIGVVDWNNINPIPLTPEILEKCGFVSNPYQDRYELGNIHVEHCAVRNMLWIEKAPHIQYLHQLQNYVYTNTNTELNYTP